MAKLDYQPGHIRVQLQRIATAPLTVDLCMITLPAVAALSLVSLFGNEDIRHISRMSMSLPVAWLTLKHGWRAAVTGGTIAIIATCLLTASKPDPQILETQAFIALAITLLIATGARISTQLRQERLRKDQHDNALAIARRALQTHELRRRELSKSLENLALTLHVGHAQMLQQIQRFVPRVESEPFMRKAAEAPEFVFQLTDSLHPALWRERGLPAALNGTIARALDEANIAYRCVITGRGYARMSAETLNAAYRTACEAVALVTSQLACLRVQLTVRGGETHGRRWLVMRVEGFHESNQVASALVNSRERARIAQKLGALTLDVDQLRELAQLFHGQLHNGSSNEGTQITLLLHDMQAQAESSDVETQPLRLWVH
jgi:FlaA1/EpsC-like NDP-sugar epimerase